MRVVGNWEASSLLLHDSNGSKDARLRAVFQCAATGIALCDLEGSIVECNPVLTRILGLGSHQLVGRRFWEILSGDHSDCTPLLDQLLRGTRESFLVGATSTSNDGVRRSGNWNVSTARDEQDRPAFLIAVFEDTTQHQREAEQLRQAEKMEVIGRLAGGIAHDFNNLLTGILLYCDLLAAGLERGGRLRQHVEEIRLAGEQGAALTQQLLTVARKEVPQPQPVLIQEVVASTKNLLRRLIGEQIELITVLEPATRAVLADPAQVRQILLNLVLNGRDAMAQGGRITVSIGNGTMLPGEKESVVLGVEDEGCGMDLKTRERVFEPFFTTKTAGHGTGLGLSTVQRIVTELRGTIKIASEPGSGTRIEVFLPSIKPPASPSASRVQRGGTILLVDDHATARKSMQRVLQHSGYRVRAACSGKRALKIFAEHSGEIDLLITDLWMPEITGSELAGKLQRKKPSLKVLLISGYHDHITNSTSMRLIRKPFSSPVLIERIREVLDCKEGLSC